MVQLPILDETLYNLQRQGRISFYVSPWCVFNDLSSFMEPP